MKIRVLCEQSGKADWAKNRGRKQKVGIRQKDNCLRKKREMRQGKSGRMALFRNQVELKGHGVSVGWAEYPGRRIVLVLGVGGGWLGRGSGAEARDLWWEVIEQQDAQNQEPRRTSLSIGCAISEESGLSDWGAISASLNRSPALHLIPCVIFDNFLDCAVKMAMLF